MKYSNKDLTSIGILTAIILSTSTFLINDSINKTSNKDELASILSSTIDKSSLPHPVTSPHHSNGKETVIMVIDNNLYQVNQIKTSIDRYEKDYSDYKFIRIFISTTSNPVTDFHSIGGNIKQNTLEVRNTIKQIYDSQRENLVGVFVIGNIRPTIWRDATIWRDLGQSGFYPSIYPLIALDSDYYSNFDVTNEGFMEKPGLITGSEIGGGYNASIWGAVLIPPPTPYIRPPCQPNVPCMPVNTLSTTTNLLAKDLIVNYFNRDHAYITKKLKYDNKLLYSNTFGCSSAIYQKVNSSSAWGKTSNTFLCPNLNPQLNGFDSVYQILIHNQGPSYDPTKIGFQSINAINEQEKTELSNWASKDYFGNSTLALHGGPYDYYFLLHLKGRSLSDSQIATVLKSNLPNIICQRISNCSVYVGEFGFEEPDGSWNGLWSSYVNQQHTWTSLYADLLENNSFQLTYISTHGSPMGHLFNIDSDTVKRSAFNSMIYEIESCNTGNYLSPDYIAGDYLFYGNTLGVSAYSIPFLIQGENGYTELDNNLRFLKITKKQPVIDALFLKNYGNYIYFGDPLLRLDNK